MKKMINWAAVVMVALTMSIGCGGDDTISVSDEDAAKMQQMSEAMAGDGGTMTETGDVADPGTEGEEGGEEAAEGGEEAAEGGEEAAEGGEEAAEGGEEAAEATEEEAAEGTE